MTTLGKLRKALSKAATVGEAAKLAKELAGDPANAPLLPELVAMLADTLIAPPSSRPRGRPRKVTLADAAVSNETAAPLVSKHTMENAALSEYAYIVNARNIADKRKPEFAAYGVDMTPDEAIRYLKDRRLYSHGRQGIKARARKYVISSARLFSCDLTVDAFDVLKKKLCKHD